MIQRSSRSYWGSLSRAASRLVWRRRGGAIVWMIWLLQGALAVCVAFAGQDKAGFAAGFDRAGLEQELSRPVLELERQGTGALRTHVQRLTEFYASLDLAPGISPEERRVLSDHILVRVAQVGLLAREGNPTTESVPKARSGAMSVTSWAVSKGALGFLGENSLLVVGLLGGLVIAYALGSLAGYHRGASQASYYGAGDPRMWFATRAREGAAGLAEFPVRITLDQIRRTLASGRTVLMQLGYEIAPSHRREFLGLIREMHQMLSEVDGQAHTVWEDPRHPNRFYEIVVCHRLEALDVLTSDLSALAGLDTRIEKCWLPGRPVLRRAWWGVVPEPGEDGRLPVAQVSSSRRTEERVS